MRKLNLLGAMSALALAGPVYAQAPASALSYSFVEVGYVDSEIDDADVDGNGIGLRASWALTEQFHVFAEYVDLGFDFDIDANTFEIGGGMRWPMGTNLDLYGTVSYVQAEVEVSGPGFGRFSVDDDGFGVGIGLRTLLTDKVELGGKIDYVDLSDSGNDTTFGVAGRYYLTSQLAVGLDINFDDDGTTWIVGGRFDFGK
jgi:opacity protein-like surface antigen